MRKICLLIILCGIFPGAARAEPLVDNGGIYQSAVYQFIVLNCRDQDCLQWLVGLAEKINNPVLTLDSGGSDTKFDNAFLADKPLMSEIILSSPQKTDEEKKAETAAAVVGIVPAQNSAVSAEKINVESANQDVGLDSPTENKSKQSPAPAIQPGAMRINEVMSAPMSGQSEWVELYNASSSAVDLSGSVLVEGAGKVTTLTGVIEPAGYMIFEKSSLNNDGDIVIFKNSAGAVVDELRYGKVDFSEAPAAVGGHSIIYWNNSYVETEIPTPKQQNVFMLTIAAPASEAAEIKEEAMKTETNNANSEPMGGLVEKAVELAPTAEAVLNGSPEIKAEKTSEPQFQFSDLIRINEFLADPAGSDDAEWIELYNPGEQNVDLFGWTLDDAEGGSQPFKINQKTIIKVGDYLVFQKDDTGLNLNNSSDSVVLRDPSGKEISYFDYQKTKENYSYARIGDGWQETMILTPGAENKSSALAAAKFVEEKKVSLLPEEQKTALTLAQKKISYLKAKITLIEDINKLALKTKVAVAGFAVVLPGVFAKNYMYVVNADASRGIQIYFDKAQWPEIEVGDWIEATGAISENLGERRVLVRASGDLTISKRGDLPAALKISSLEISNFAGGLVQLTGEVVKKESNKLILADNSGEFVVMLKPGAHIDLENVMSGDELSVAGIVRVTDNGAQILLRGQDDLLNFSGQGRLNAKSVEESYAILAKKKKKIAGWIVFCVFTAAGLVIAARRRKAVTPPGLPLF